MESLRILLLGKTGTGKSATGNSILGRPVFETSVLMTSDTRNIRSETVDLPQGRRIQVVDGPGLMNTRHMLDRERELDQLVADFTSAFDLCGKGFNVLLFVMNYGSRYTQEEIETLNILKGIFGKDFVRHNCVCVFTNGENFVSENETNDFDEMQKSFDTYLRRQTGSIQELLKDCQYRCVLFQNGRRVSEEVKKNQRDWLLNVIDSMPSKNRLYNSQVFQNARKTEDLKQILKALLQSSVVSYVLILTEGVRRYMQRKDSGDNPNEIDVNFLVDIANKLMTLLKQSGNEESYKLVSEMRANLDSPFYDGRQLRYFCDALYEQTFKPPAREHWIFQKYPFIKHLKWQAEKIYCRARNTPCFKYASIAIGIFTFGLLIYIIMENK